MQAIGQVLMCPLKEADVKASLSRLGTFEDLFDLALTADHT